MPLKGWCRVRVSVRVRVFLVPLGKLWPAGSYDGGSRCVGVRVLKSSGVC